MLSHFSFNWDCSGKGLNWHSHGYGPTDVSLLVLLDLSAAFNTIDHRTLLNILENDYGIVGDAQKWFESFLSARKWQIVLNQQLSKPFDLYCGVPQGSCLGHALFLLYASGLFKVMAKHLPEAHAYAITHAHNHIFLLHPSSNSQRDAIKVIEECIAEVRIWMVSHWLLINDMKTEFIFGSYQQLSKVSIESIAVGTSVIIKTRGVCP